MRCCKFLPYRLPLCLLAAFLAIPAFSRAEPAFDLTEVDSMDYGPTGIVDVDGDGFNDIIAINHLQQTLAWYRYPDLAKQVVASVSNYQSDDIEIADIDGDGDPDVLGREEITVCWWENTGPGTVWPRHNLRDTDYIKDVGTGDFNRDGRLDIVAREETRTYIWLQQDPNQWDLIKTIQHNDNEGMDIGDLDLDGDDDIVLNGFWFETPDPSQLAGEWTWHSIDDIWYTQTGGFWRDNNSMVALGDMNADGRLDVLISHSELPGYPVAWYSSPTPRTGPWNKHVVAPVYDYCQTLRAGDIDNDGDLDILASKFSRDDGAVPQPFTTTVYLNNDFRYDGDGSVWAGYEIGTTGMYHGQLGDWGNDGDLDLISLRSYWTGPLELWQNRQSENKLALNQWQYVQVDGAMPRRIDKTGGPGWFFGLATSDVDADGDQDILAHKFLYRNPGGDMTGAWIRQPLGWDLLDVLLAVNVDDDGLADLIAQGEAIGGQLQIYWVEALDANGDQWERTVIGTVPQDPDHLWSQQYATGQLEPGERPEILIGGGDGIYYFEIPDNPTQVPWPRVNITQEGLGYAVGDIDADGYPDVAGYYDAIHIAWWKNPTDGSGNWTRYPLGDVEGDYADRFAVADINGDGRLDIVVSEEVYPVDLHPTSAFWFAAPPEPNNGAWTRHTIVNQTWSLNSMSVVDVDRDGDDDVVLGEMGQTQRTFICANDGHGQFAAPVIVDLGKENHLGARTADLDLDGDLDIIGIGWNDFQRVKLWRNDADPIEGQNQPPQISLEPVQTAARGIPAQIAATITDDGLPANNPNENGTLIAHWEALAGPSAVQFDNADLANPMTPFSKLGYYQLQVTASDGELSGQGQTYVQVVLPGDLNIDWKVDFPDELAFSLEFTHTPCWPGNTWCNGSDINRDGRVSISDYSFLSANWLASDLDPLDQGLIAYWRLDDAQGAIAIDTAGHAQGPFDATLSGDPSWLTDEMAIGTALKFDGTDDYLDVGVQPALTGLQMFSVTTWIKLDQILDRQPIITNEGHETRGLSLQVNKDGQLYLQLYHSQISSDLTGILGDQTLNPDQWYLVAFTYTASNGQAQARLYLDGELVGQADQFPPLVNQQTEPLVVGRYYWSSEYSRFFAGTMDDIRIYERVLGPEELIFLDR